MDDTVYNNVNDNVLRICGEIQYSQSPFPIRWALDWKSETFLIHEGGEEGRKGGLLFKEISFWVFGLYPYRQAIRKWALIQEKWDGWVGWQQIGRKEAQSPLLVGHPSCIKWERQEESTSETKPGISNKQTGSHCRHNTCAGYSSTHPAFSSESNSIKADLSDCICTQMTVVDFFPPH
jgi:hypothetical protein